MNPIMEALNANQQSRNNTLSQIGQIAGSIKNPEAMYKSMMQTNPQFAKFMKENEGKTWEQIAQENGINPAMLRPFMR